MRLERVLAISSACKLRVDTGRLTVVRPDEPERYISLPDIAALIIETPEAVLTAATLQRLAEHGIPILVTNASHLPTAILFPCAERVATVDRQRAQASCPTEITAILWQKLIQAKITNQAELLRRRGHTASLARLERLVSLTQPGDSSNCEAQAAQIYWKALCGKQFHRDYPDAEDTLNAAFNFGYAILRALLARYISLAGLSPVFGCGHNNRENPLCLVDDLVEPYRPFVDAIVTETIKETTPWDRSAKQTILTLLETPVGWIDKRYRLSAAAFEQVQSYASCVQTHVPSGLLTPIWMPET